MKHFDKKLAAILLVALFALAACQNSLDSSENVSEGNATGNVVISIGGGGGEGGTARTLAPDNYTIYTELGGLAYHLSFSGSDGATHADETINYWQSKRVFLSPGNWTITAQAKDGNVVKAEGSWTGEVSASGDTNEPPVSSEPMPVEALITLVPKTGSGDGTLDYTVYFPELGEGGSASLTLYAVTKTGDSVVEGTPRTITSGTSSIEDLPAGFYRLKLSLTNSEGQSAVRTEAVHIYAGLTTSAAFDFAWTDFAEEVSAAAGLYVGDSGTPAAISPFTLSAALDWLRNNAASNTAYTIVLGADENISSPKTLDMAGLNNASNVSITLRGKGAERTIEIEFNSYGYSLFTIDTGVTLILDQNITLTNSHVMVNVEGTLEMRDGAKITGHGVSNYGTFTMAGGEISGNTIRGGVYNTGTFTMTGGKISGNTDDDGGGVYNTGTFTMVGGEISDNTASSYDGGGVYNTGTFTMKGGKISGNTASGSGGGGGVYNNTGTFTMEDGEISGNTVNSGYGGGVCNYNTGTFTMKGGKISDNIGGGGGVYNFGTFTMKGGEISGNEAGNFGGGVYNSGTFTMEDGKISENTTSGSGGGGGVLNSDSSTFTMKGGEISGNEAGSFGGGGVYNYNTGTFNMEDGEISDNTTSGDGGGVYNNSTFTMKDGEISDNTASGDGGGVYNGYGCTFTMKDGEISDNTASDNGGGVYNNSYSTFIMEDGEISDNTSDNGGGVYNNSTFTMKDGEISDNTSGDGGGVYNNNGPFTMEDGKISDNIASGNGGGVYNFSTFTMAGGEISGNTGGEGGGVYNNITFTKTGGVIYGDTDNTHTGSTENTATSGNGHAVYGNGRKRNSDAGPGVNLDSNTADNWD